MLHPTMRRFSTAVTITDPLVKYQTAVSMGLYSPDPAQHRLAHHLQKLYRRIKDYRPQSEYRERLNQVARLTDPKPPADADTSGMLALRNHPIWRNPLFKHLLTSPEGRESLALTRKLTSHEAAIDIDSPKGLFLSGEVGTGKSMLLDLLAEGLPTERKKRWHFNTFMLYVFSRLETFRKANPGTAADGDSEHSLLWMAKTLVEESPILFLDEFQLPDRAASKLLSHLFIAFFQLGGVLIASSNRMPEELQKAIGVDYTPTPSQGLIRKIFGLGSAGKGELYGASSDFSNFLEVLKARCDFWQMEGAQDWRRKEEITEKATGAPSSGPTSEAPFTSTYAPEEPSEVESVQRKKPHHYHLTEDNEGAWKQRIQEAVGLSRSTPIPWSVSSLVVYGRKVQTPQHYKGFVFWEFDSLVESFGPADYITMASTYHTFVIDNVPILTISKKNEARRFITLLDALYEARCKLILRARNPPDDLFFPERSRRSAGAAGQENVVDDDDDATYSETVAEVYQDQVSPFRPNVAYYDTQSSTAKYNPDQDSDFGLQSKPINFTNTTAFTGEDERFAYKRAISRLWELCSHQWHSRTGDWWQPLPLEARHWEGGQPSQPQKFTISPRVPKAGEGMGQSVEIDEVAGLSKWRVEQLQNQSRE